MEYTTSRPVLPSCRDLLNIARPSSVRSSYQPYTIFPEAFLPQLSQPQNDSYALPNELRGNSLGQCSVESNTHPSATFWTTSLGQQESSDYENIRDWEAPSTLPSIDAIPLSNRATTFSIHSLLNQPNPEIPLLGLDTTQQQQILSQQRGSMEDGSRHSWCLPLSSPVNASSVDPIEVEGSHNGLQPPQCDEAITLDFDASHNTTLLQMAERCIGQRKCGTTQRRMIPSQEYNDNDLSLTRSIRSDIPLRRWHQSRQILPIQAAIPDPTLPYGTSQSSSPNPPYSNSPRHPRPRKISRVEGACEKCRRKKMKCTHHQSADKIETIPSLSLAASSPVKSAMNTQHAGFQGTQLEKRPCTTPADSTSKKRPRQTHVTAEEVLRLISEGRPKLDEYINSRQLRGVKKFPIKSYKKLTDFGEAENSGLDLLVGYTLELRYLMEQYHNEYLPMIFKCPVADIPEELPLGQGRLSTFRTWLHLPENFYAKLQIGESCWQMEKRTQNPGIWILIVPAILKLCRMHKHTFNELSTYKFIIETSSKYNEFAKGGVQIRRDKWKKEMRKI
ncbi:hypothetical protein BGW36DRAFT_362947 [Talaromyces proteolyticus]|uniref:Zn(2)-C6 fungal-type domain-containing protein n=1 Tax=Talaromyces proteolyticus TaxID=1131652 RepID=A0AAD4KHJ0_9EURO|nr:uncharacterized protein BGW36DRAFT_362947 [Talaromyces proteolyticus]KAH8691920.1 hypothetical protein BGW36DRAFT_362947 [Talaromyces proteolyticus]